MNDRIETPPPASEHKCVACSQIARAEIRWWHLSDARQRKFMRAYEKSGSLTAARKLMKTTFRFHYKWLKECPDYVDCYNNIKLGLGQMLEDVAIDRAVNGVDTPVTYQGEITAHYKTYDNKLLMQLLRANGGEQYRRGPSTKINVNIKKLDARQTLLQAIQQVKSTQGGVGHEILDSTVVEPVDSLPFDEPDEDDSDD